jgi:hypothetical protein
VGYSESPVLAAPADLTVLWRYVDFAKFVSMLTTRTLWFARADTLNDKHEGAIGVANLQRRAALWNALMPGDAAARAQEFKSQTTRSMREHIYLSCWHANDRESMAMWLAYARQGEGIAIKTTFRTLVDSLESEADIFASAVAYVDFSSQLIPEGNFFFPYIHKRLSFDYEREVRLMMVHYAPEPASPTDPTPQGIAIHSDPAALMEAVYVGPGIPSWYFAAVRDVVAALAPGVPVHQSALDAEPLF